MSAATIVSASKEPVSLAREGAPTFRDFGGIPVEGGYIASRRVYRSGAFTALTPTGIALRDALGIRLVCDLRTPMERNRFPVKWSDPVPKALGAADGVDLYDTSERHIRGMYTVENGQLARDLVMNMYADMHRVYAGILHALFSAIADKRDLPLLINCSAGKDRTGFVSAVLLFALGASEGVVENDYMLTDQAWGAEQIRHAVREKAGRDAHEAVLQALRVHPDYLRNSLSVIRKEFGSMDGYLASLGLDDTRRLRLRGALVVPT